LKIADATRVADQVSRLKREKPGGGMSPMSPLAIVKPLS
jgi:hypothetical protein